MNRSHEKVLRAFGQAVRFRRRELGLSQEKLAELADLHRTYVADIERGSRNVGLVNIVRLAEALGVPAGNLFEAMASRK
jgi:transcriptional regulator with XRE-family HTH domain